MRSRRGTMMSPPETGEDSEVAKLIWPAPAIYVHVVTKEPSRLMKSPMKNFRPS